MPKDIEWPDKLRVNAWTGSEGPSAKLAASAGEWCEKPVTSYAMPAHTVMRFADFPPDLRQWADEKVGWGLVLPENEAVSKKDRASGKDAPEPIKKLLEARPGSPVFRYRSDVDQGYLRCYYRDGNERDVRIGGGERGTAPKCLPYYILICGSPQQIPWNLQYVLNSCCFVGRLDLDEYGLACYVDALINNWDGSICKANYPVVWAVDHGKQDITWLMRRTIADPIADKMAGDSMIGNRLSRLAGKNATVGKLTEALAENHPALIVTTSHGMTGPLDNQSLMAQQLGGLVDDNYAVLQPGELLKEWQPDGAIWYSHACCSAGSGGRNSYKGLLTEGSSVDKTLDAVGALEALVAPLPNQLLGADKPLRAFIGQVEPTFDWTLRAETGQVLTATIQQALWHRMFSRAPEPVGMAFERYYQEVGMLSHQLLSAGLPPKREVRTRLSALDRQSTVILGDPTACIPVMEAV